jgi:antagonist of KipI
MDIIDVLDGGLLTTVQDLGRFGYQRYGVPVSGAADRFALRVANRLVGNDDSAAGLEVTLIGPRLRFLADTVVALAGADLSPRLDGEPVSTWEPFAVCPGSTLSFGDANDGARAYLTVAGGGIHVPVVLGSRSTHVRSRLGGLEGRAVQAGDRLETSGREAPRDVEGRRLPRGQVPSYGHSPTLRVVLGPQDDAFTERGMETFLSFAYAVSSQSDRIGYRLQGPVIEHASSPDIVSDGTPNGAVQVAGDGMPIVLLVDRGTTGGYTKIATVITADLSLLAQAAAGDSVTFRAVTVDEAHSLLREEEERLRQLVDSPAVRFARQRYRVTVDGVAADVDSGLAEVIQPQTGTSRSAAQVEATVRVTGERSVRSCRVEVEGLE